MATAHRTSLTVDYVAGVDIPRLMQMISPPKPKEEPQGPPPSQQGSGIHNPFGATDDNPFDDPEDEDYIIREREKASYERTFLTLGPVGGKLTGAQVKTALMETGVPNQVLRKVWTLSDIDKDGKLDLDEFAIATRYSPFPPRLASCPDEVNTSVFRLCEIAKKSPDNPIPFEMLPATLVPPSKVSYFTNGP